MWCCPISPLSLWRCCCFIAEGCPTSGQEWCVYGCKLKVLSAVCIVTTRGVQNPTKMSDIGFLKTELNWPQNSKTENSVSAILFSKNRLWRFGDGFSRCFIHNSSCSMVRSTVKVFFFVLFLCTSSSESLQLTISWTNSARKYVISSIIS